MKKWILLSIFLVATGLVGLYLNTRAAAANPLDLQISAALDQHDYAKAIPLLQERAAQLKDDPKATSVIQTQIALCQAKVGPVKDDSPVATNQEVAQLANDLLRANDAKFVTDPNTGGPRTPHPKPTGKIQEMTIQQLGNFDFDPEKDTTVPSDVLALNGLTVILPGYISPFDQADILTYFAITPSLNGCCFGKPAGVQHTIICHATADRQLRYTTDQVMVTGRLTVKPIRENDYTHTIFTLDVQSITPVGPQ